MLRNNLTYYLIYKSNKTIQIFFGKFPSEGWLIDWFIGVLVRSMLHIVLVFCVVPLCVFTFWVPCYDVRYDFRIKMMFSSCIPPVICKRAHVLLTLFVFVCVKWCPTKLCCALVLFFFVLCILCSQFLWIVLFWLSLRYSLTFIYRGRQQVVARSTTDCRPVCKTWQPEVCWSWKSVFFSVRFRYYILYTEIIWLSSVTQNIQVMNILK